jgi:hypothetical protein
VLFALAFYTKQTAVDAAAATTLWLIAGDTKRGLKMASALIALVVVPFAAVNLVTQGGLWEHVGAARMLPWSARRALRIGARLWGEYWPILIWAGGAVVTAVLGFGFPVLKPNGRSKARPERTEWLDNLRSKVGSPWGLAVLYVVVAAISVLTRIGDDGINYNHLLEVLLPVCLLVGLSTGWLVRWLIDRRPVLGLQQIQTDQRPEIFSHRTAITAITLCAFLMIAQLFEFNDPHTWYSGMWPDPNRDGQMRALSKLVADTPGDILSDDSYLLESNGHLVVYDDTYQFITLGRLGRWDDEVFVQSIRDRRFALMFLFDTDRWTAEEQTALADNYSLKFPDILSTYVPRVFPASPEYRMECRLSGNENEDTALLDGYSLAPGVAWVGVKRGDVLRATLYWRSTAPLQRDYASYVHMVNDKGENLASQDNPHTGAIQSTTAWSTSSLITDTASIPIPVNILPGRYRLVAGMYYLDASTGVIKDLPASCQQGELYGDAVSLGSVEVK